MSVRAGDVLLDLSRHLRYEPTEKRVRAVLGGQVVADSRRAVLVWEPDAPTPTYAIPHEDISATVDDGSPAAADAARPGRLVALMGGDGHVATGLVPDDPYLSGFVVCDFPTFDSWLEEDDEIQAHPRDPFHRVDLRNTSRRIRIALGDEVLADTTRGKLLFETTLPTRYYIPRSDVLPELLPSPKRTRCPYKGEASYWSFTTNGHVARDLVWSYETPLPDAAGLQGYVAFYDEQFDLVLGARAKEQR